MSRDMRTTGSVSQSDGPKDSSIQQEMLNSTAISHNTDPLRQEYGEMSNGQYSTGQGDMMMADDSLDILAKENNSGQLENTGEQQPPAAHLGYYDDNIAAGFSGGNYATLQMDEGDTQFTHLGQDANNPNGHAAVKQGSDQETKNDHWNLNLDYSMAKPEHDDQAHSSGIQHMSELPRGAPQDAIMNDEFLYQEHEGSKYLNLPETEVGTEVGTNLDAHGVAVQTDGRLTWSEVPAAQETDFESQSQHAVLQKSNDNVQPERQYGGLMTLGIVDQLLGPGSRQPDEPSIFTGTVDSRHNQGTVQSGYEDTTMSMTGKETVDQYTQPSNARPSDPWLIPGMNEVQHHQAPGRPIGFNNASASRYHSLQNSNSLGIHNSFPQSQTAYPTFPNQQQLSPYNQSPVDTLFTHQQHLQAQVEEKRRQLENARRLHEQDNRHVQQGSRSSSFAQNQNSLPASFLMGPLSYQRAPQSEYRQQSSGNNNPSFWLHMQPSSSQSQIELNGGSGPYSGQGQEVAGTSIDMDRQIQGLSAIQGWSKTQLQDTKEEKEEDSKDKADDEPLIARTKCQASITSQPSAVHASSPPPNTTNTPIDWKLPQYDIQVEPTSSTNPSDPSIPTAKISLPGLVREELLLSPDYPDQELHLFLNLFLPSHRALSTPDPQPAVAVLNFHTIALMVIEAYVQYEIGDELGRRNPCYATSSSGSHEGKMGKGEKEYERIRDARTADVDEIFFAVVDRWRAGLESGKKNLKLIRGVQEFCDVALDVIFYIKEHGLLGAGEEEEGDREMEEAESKGKGKGKARANNEEGASVLKAKPKGKQPAAIKKKAGVTPSRKGKGVVKKEEPKKRVRKPAAVVVVKK